MADQKKLAIVVGAGASSEYGLPIGSALKRDIADLLNIRFENGYLQSTGDRMLWDALKNLSRPNNEDPNDYRAACLRMRDALPQAPSIDQFIHTQRGNRRIEVCGKLAIALAILRAEARSNLYIKPNNPGETLNFEAMQGTWLDALFRVIVDGCTADELDSRFAATSLIVFNYDRCIEHYLFHALRNYYAPGISDSRASQLIGRLNIFHAYGSVGELPWQRDHESVSFGGSGLTATDLISVASGIRTFTEGTSAHSSDLAGIRGALAFAPRILFLGFAFHVLNLELLAPKPTSPAQAGRRIIGTAFGISAADQREIAKELADAFSCDLDQVDLRDNLKAGEVFGEYTRALAFQGQEA